MKKEFIPYEQALALKELEFDEPCFGKYLSNLQSDWKKFELILEMGMNEEFEDNRNIYLLEEACSASTFSQAFRWFREKYGLYSWVTMELGNKSTFCWVLSGEHTSTQYAAYFYTYEEAELACLDKLIEIIKAK